MLMSNYTSEFLNLKDVIITKVENTADQLHIHIELPRSKHTCPSCGALTDRIHDYRIEIAPRLADAYRIKNEFLDVMRSESSAAGKPKLIDWLFSVEVMDLAEFHDCTKAYHNWFQQILNSMDVPWTNGYIEGCNNKTKVLKHVCFGMRNFSNFRKRILFCNS